MGKKNLVHKNIINFKDLDDLSDISRSQKSTYRKLEQEKKEMLFKIVTQGEIDKIGLEIQKEIKQQRRSPSQQSKAQKLASVHHVNRSVQ